MDKTPPRRPLDRVRGALIAGSLLALLVVVLLRGDTSALLAVAGLAGLLCGIVVLARRNRTGAKGRRGAGVVLALGAVGLFLGGTAFGAPLPGPTAATPAAQATAAPASPTTAADALAALPVAPAASMAGYRRARFGARWTDVDLNGCDTRDDVLRRDLTDRVEGRCRVATGVLLDPYTGRRIEFARGGDTGATVRIDRVVTLADAWRTGAAALPKPARVALANEPGALLAVNGSANGDRGDAATWLPERTSLRCAYVARQVAVKAAYRLWVTPAERDAIAAVLARCPDQPLPTMSLATSAGRAAAGPTASPLPTPSAEPTADSAARVGARCAPVGAAGTSTAGAPVRCEIGPDVPRARWHVG